MGGGGASSGGAPSGGSSSGNGGLPAGGAAGSGGGGGGPTAEPWVGTWATAQQTTEPANLPPAPGLAGNTLRQLVRVSMGGSKLRLRLSNEHGTAPVTLGAVHVAISKGGGAIEATTDTALTFEGAPTVTIPVGKTATSDAFDFTLAPLADVAISLHFTSQTGEVTGHPGSRTTSFLQTGNAVTSASMPNATRTDHWYFIAGLDVLADQDSGAVVVLGDSITDGRGSTTNQNDRWPDQLAKRLQASPATAKVAVLNMGIGGNAVLKEGLGPTGLERFDRDVLGQSGVRWLIVLEGVNDIGTRIGDAKVADELIAAYQQFVTKAHQANIRAYGVPILPFAGSQYAGAESARQTVNTWIRTSGTFDAVIDLDAAVRDPNDAKKLLGSYDSGDHLHLSPAGYLKMAEAVDLSLFTTAAR